MSNTATLVSSSPLCISVHPSSSATPYARSYMPWLANPAGPRPHQTSLRLKSVQLSLGLAFLPVSDYWNIPRESKGRCVIPSIPSYVSPARCCRLQASGMLEVKGMHPPRGAHDVNASPVLEPSNLTTSSPSKSACGDRRSLYVTPHSPSRHHNYVRPKLKAATASCILVACFNRSRVAALQLLCMNLLSVAKASLLAALIKGSCRLR